MKRKILWGLLIGVVILGAVIGGFWYMSMQPLYTPGTLGSAPLAPPAQIEGSETWLVEEGIELAHFAEGEGRNVLVIHGGPGVPFLAPMSGLEPLTAEYQFHYYAQRGSGESTRPIESFSSSNMYENMQTLDETLGLGAQLADIERIRQILGEEKLIIMGHSWGGLLASLYAAEFPENIERLILITPADMLVMPQPESDSDLFSSVRANLPEEKYAGYDLFVEEYFDFQKLFNKTEQDLIDQSTQFGEYFEEALAEPLPAQGKPGGWMVWAQYTSLGQRYDFRPHLENVQAPVLVIHGTNDFQSEAASRLYADAFPNAEFVVIEGTSHFPFEQQPAAFAEVVTGFLK